MKFKEGETIYHIHAFPHNGKAWINKLVVVHESIMKYVDISSIIVHSIDKSYTEEISLRDANIIPNKYNCHRIFRTEEAANEYVSKPNSWRPLGYSEEEWLESRKDEYLANTEYNIFMDSLYE